MGKSKRDTTTPRRRVSMTKKRTFDRTIAKVISRPNSAVSSTQPSIANIRVVVRVRPPNLRERDDNHRCVVKVVDEQMLVFDPKEETQGFFFHGTQQKGRDFLKKANKDMKFVFDKVFPEESVTEEVFKNTTYTLINSLMSGFNCSVFAYGATGAGKTFTMTGNTTNPGVTFLTMTELFEKKEELSQERDFEIGITYLEVYNELVKDLLNPGPPLNLREDAKYGVTVAGIKVYEIKKPDELFSLLEQGNKNRTQHPTDANSESSRSHAVFQVYLKMTMKGTKEIRTAKLSMIDLAGSERGSATGFAGARFTEGANINKSLLALGNCINSLADGLRHVPYRDSKLTRLLKDSLGGNCQTVMIANVSPSSLSFEDTYNTLKYATRAKKIKSAAKRNVVSVEMHVGHYVKLVEELRAEVARLKTEAAERSGGEGEATERKEEEEKVGRLQEKVARLEAELLESYNDVEKYRGECDRMRGLLEKTEGENGVIAEGDVEAIGEIKRLLLEKRECLERRSQLEKSESTTILRRLLKEEIDSRVSVSAADSTEKVEAHRRVRAAIERFRRKESALKENIEDVGGRSSEVDKRLKEIARERPHLKRQLDAELMDLKNLKLKHQVEQERKTIELLLDDREGNSTLVGKMSTALWSFYQLLQGNQLLTPDLVEQYRDVGAALRGRRNVKWLEEGEEREKEEGEKEDSGVGSVTSVPLSDGGSNRSACVKRKMEDAGAADAEVLDRTFSLPATAAASSTTAAPGKGVKATTGGQTRDQIVSKAALKVAPMKRLATQRRDLKSSFRRPFESNTMTAARALVSAKLNSAAFRGTSKTPTKELSARPRFRS